ncbi:MAG: hypothetical protein ACTHNQ_07780 [Microbacterium sp.]|uniref:hypothetical protein n=1 Tax=Microbacterium sp. TaxID=51671 RepID=UPI003F7E09BF
MATAAPLDSVRDLVRGLMRGLLALGDGDASEVSGPSQSSGGPLCVVAQRADGGAVASGMD